MIQCLPPERNKGFMGHIVKWGGLARESGTAPLELRLTFKLRGYLPRARKVLNKVLHEWEPEKLVIAHGYMAEDAAAEDIDCLPLGAKESSSTPMLWLPHGYLE